MANKTIRKLAFSSGKHSINKDNKYYTVGIFTYNQTRRRYLTKTVNVKENDIYKFIKNPNIMLANGFIKEGNIPVIHGYYAGKTGSLITKVAKSTRELMEQNYGTGSKLCGRGHEACSIMMAALNFLRIFGSEIVDCFVLFPDGSYCKHHILKLEGTYIDVTGDQFNRVLPKELQFKPVSIKRVLPDNIHILSN